jgi:hypothetical protein
MITSRAKPPTFTSDESVRAWADQHGVDALRELVRSERMRSSSQYWGATWLARHDAPVRALARDRHAAPQQPSR